MLGVVLLAFTTLCYAGYNLLLKQSAAQAETAGANLIGATIALQCAALAVSLGFLLTVRLHAGAAVTAPLPAAAYGWALAAGVCIGAAEIGYFFLFRGVGSAPPLPVSLVTPTVVAGTVLLALLAARILYREPFGWPQLAGGALIIAGVALLFARSRNV